MSEPGQHTGWSTAVTTANPPNALSNGIDLCLGLVAAGHLHQFHIPIHLLQAAAATTVRRMHGGEIGWCQQTLARGAGGALDGSLVSWC